MALVTRITRPTWPAAAAPGPVLRVDGGVDVGVDEDVHVGEAAGQRRVAHVGQAPDHARDITALLVDGDDLAHPLRARQTGRERVPQPMRGAGDGYGRRRPPLANRRLCGAQGVLLPG